MTRLTLAIAIAVSTLAACAQPRNCQPIALSPAAQTSLAAIAAGSSFPVVRPVSCDAQLRVEQVFVDALPEGGAQLQRVNFIVSRDGERGFVLSETRATVAFTRIPQGTHQISASSGGVTASGFAGPAGTGDEIAYLRWRIEGVTFELHATLRPWLTERDLRSLAEALIEAAQQ